MSRNARTRLWSQQPDENGDAPPTGWDWEGIREKLHMEEWQPVGVEGCYSETTFTRKVFVGKLSDILPSGESWTLSAGYDRHNEEIVADTFFWWDVHCLEADSRGLGVLTGAELNEREEYGFAEDPDGVYVHEETEVEEGEWPS